MATKLTLKSQMIKVNSNNLLNGIRYYYKYFNMNLTIILEKLQIYNTQI